MTELEIDLQRDEILGDVYQYFHYINDLPISEDEKQELISDITHYVILKINK